MIARLANMDTDALGIHRASIDFISRMQSADFMPENEDDLMAAIGRIIDMDVVEVVVAEEDGEILGCLGMMYAPFTWNPDLIMANEIFIWTARHAPKTTFLRMLKLVQERIKVRGAGVVEFGSLPSSPPGLGAVYRKMGLHPSQTVWTGVV